MLRPLRPAFLLACVLAGLGLVTACNREPGKMEWQPPPAPAEATSPLGRAPCANRDPLRQPFFGDLHVHTGYSVDAWVQDTFATPDDAYRFATGEPIALPPFAASGQPLQQARIDRPLDFAAVTDHAEWLAERALCTTPSSSVYDTKSCRIFRGESQSLFTPLLGLEGLAARMAGPAGFLDRSREVCGPGARRCRDALLTVWGDTQAAAERAYDRSSACRFTSFHAWEYSRAPASTKIHRNVILRNEIAPELPFSWIDTPTAPDLWDKLRDLCIETDSGCDALGAATPSRSPTTPTSPTARCSPSGIASCRSSSSAPRRACAPAWSPWWR